MSNLLNRFKLRLTNLMRGRYGIDALYRALMGLTISFLVLNLLFPSIVFYTLSLASVFWSSFRVFSRNHAKRASENQAWLGFSVKARQKLMQTKNRIRDAKTHRYRACPSCRQVLRLPRKLGINQVRCPRCKHEFSVKIRF